MVLVENLPARSRWPGHGSGQLQQAEGSDRR